MKYPVYVISKGRANLSAHTAKYLLKDGVNCKVVVEPQESKEYKNRFGENHVAVLPFSNLGRGSIPARNWVWENSIERGFEKHWILDDNIAGFVKWKNGKRIKCSSLEALQVGEKFSDKYENLAITSINYRFTIPTTSKLKPFFLNRKAYSCLLIRNDLNYRWRGKYNEDTDLCLQVLTNGWCVVTINAYLCNKAATMTCKGGNLDELYQGSGRLQMAKELEMQWRNYPGLVKTTWKYKRPQHHVNWQFFKQQLKLKTQSGRKTFS